MGVISKILIYVMLLCLIIPFSACEGDFRTANISLYGIELSEVQAHSSAVYYLSKDGVLYCTGADSDASSFVEYQDPSKGIVALNVKSFCELSAGGCYINRSNELYMWNRDPLPLYGYDKKEKHMKVLEDITFVTASLYCMIY